MPVYGEGGGFVPTAAPIWQDERMEQPKLDKPGAGLPFFEALLVSFYVGPFQSRKADKDKNLRLFAALGAKIAKEADGAPADKRDVKVLVPRMTGIEDSSRYWSVNETLEHMMIVGVPMRELIVSLSQGKTSDYVVDTANFKPKGKYAGGDARADFRKFIEETGEILKPLKIEDAGPTHKHPWMGQFNSLQWTWLMPGHLGIHLKQLQAIKKGLLAAAFGLLAFACPTRAHAKYAIHTEIDIDAPQQKTWDVLTDLPKWPEWNPFIHYASGTLTLGNYIDVLVQPTGAKPIKGKGHVIALEAPHQMVWAAALGGSWIFRGEHHFQVDATPDGKSRFEQYEEFTGILVPLLKGKLNRETKRGFLEMNAALKARVEAKPAAAAP